MSLNSEAKLQQIAALTRLVSKFCEKDDVLECIKLAKDLANVIDELDFYNIDLNQLSKEFVSIFPEHWKKRTQFLLIVTQYWPMIAKDIGYKVDNPSAMCPKTYYPIPSDLKAFLQSKALTISESDNIYLEIQNTLNIIKQYPDKRISVISPNETYSYYLTQKLKLECIDYTSYISNDDLGEEFVSKIELHFQDYLSKIPRNKLIKELSKFSNSPKVANKLQIFGVNNYICNGEVLICSELNDIYWRYRESGAFWLHQIIRKKFGIEADNRQIESIFYKAIYDHKKVYLLRSKKSNGQFLKKSYILAKLEARLKKDKIPVNYIEFSAKTTPTKSIDNSIKTSNFIMPDEISVKSLELLFKDPCAFYVKDILNLTPNIAYNKKYSVALAIKNLVHAYFNDPSQTQSKLDSVKSLDFFAYRKCLNIIEFLKSADCDNQFNNVFGETNLSNLPFKLYAKCDRIKQCVDHAALTMYRTSDIKSVKDLLYGDDVSTLAMCLIAEKNGFKGISQPIRSIQIWNLLPGKEVVSIKNLDISDDIINSFEQRVTSRISEMLHQERISYSGTSKKNFNKYKHFERI